MNRIPFSLFIQVVSEFCSCRNPIFSSAMSSLRNAHLRWSESVPFWKIISTLHQNSLSYSSYPLVSCKHLSPSLLSLYRAPVSAPWFTFSIALGSFHPLALFGVGAPLCSLPAVQPQTHSSAFPLSVILYSHKL